MPYSNKQSPSLSGVRFHVKSEHQEKLQGFMEKYNAEMITRYKEPA